MKLRLCLIFLLLVGAYHLRNQAGHGRDAALPGEKSAATLPFDMIDNRIFVDINLNGKGPFRVIFDTGGDNIMTPEVAAALGLKVESAGKSGGTGESLVERGQTTIDEMRIGDLPVFQMVKRKAREQVV